MNDEFLRRFCIMLVTHKMKKKEGFNLIIDQFWLVETIKNTARNTENMILFW